LIFTQFLTQNNERQYLISNKNKEREANKITSFFNYIEKPLSKYYFAISLIDCIMYFQNY